MYEWKRIASVGNLRIVRKDSPELDKLFGDGPTITLYAYNGLDEIMNETYYSADETAALEAFLLKMDYCTMPYIASHLADVVAEYDGALISGKIPGHTETDWFKQTDDPRFFKHFTHRPAMNAEEYRIMHQVFKDDFITRRYLENHLDELLDVQAMSPGDLATACTYCNKLDNPFAQELVKRAGMSHENAWAIGDDSEKARVLRSAAARFRITLI